MVSFTGLSRRARASIENLLERLPWPGELHQLSAKPQRTTSPPWLQLSRTLRSGRKIGLIYIDVVRFHEIEGSHGRNVCQQILRELKSAIRETAAQHIPPEHLLAIQSLGGDDYVVYLVSSEEPAALVESLHRLAAQMKQAAKAKINEGLRLRIGQELDLHAGISVLQQSPSLSLESHLYTAIKEALNNAKKGADLENLRLVAELKDIIQNQTLSTVYQPVVSLLSGDIFGYEALTRGPEGSYFSSPLNLFSLAASSGLLYALERATRERALLNVSELAPGQKLFLNIDPQVINDRAFAGGQTRQILAQRRLGPKDVVFELTERTAIKDFVSFKKTLEHYRSQGYLIAIDDAGAGYSSLQSIAELHPDFIKIDMSLVREIDRDPLKQALLEIFITFSARINANLIAEGIETAEELSTLTRLGVSHGQGYFLARPASSPPELNPAALSILSQASRSRPRSVTFEGHSIAELAQRENLVSPSTITREVVRHFETSDNHRSVVVVRDRRVEGLVMRDKLYHRLGTPYGVSLYLERPITHVMDPNPLTVEGDTPMESVSQMAVCRPNTRLYDDILVLDKGLYLGSVTVQRLLEAITQLKVQVARYANPLTGLPGNLIIEEEIKKRLKMEATFSLIYADLDHFKAFNDRYGFERGDQVIQLTARVLADAITKGGTAGDFLGHVGGDDFVILTQTSAVDGICRYVISEFDRQVFGLYDPEDLDRGTITIRDRDGALRQFPPVSISLAVVENKDRRFSNHLEMAEVAAEVKGWAKQTPGSTYVKDRRGGG